ncbi:MAG TPA: PhzF family phenazine biosynthesis protein [Spirochaetota bacterium]
MKRFPFRKLDAFTGGKSSGNPAGMVLLEGGQQITDADMQQIAFELKGFVSEVGFVSPSHENGVDFDFRFFSSEREVLFCGHATVAISYTLASETAALKKRSDFTIRTKKGILRIENHVSDENCVYIEAPAPSFIETPTDHIETAAALGLSLSQLDLNTPLSLVDAGLRSLLVPITDLESCLSCAPDYTALRAFSQKNGIDIIVLYTSDIHFAHNNYRTRVFAPLFGYLEDPATGSGNAALGYNLIRKGMWHDERITIEQGPRREYPNIVTLRKNASGTVLIGGSGVTRIVGEYLLY